jgi:hypothetical protein
MFFMPHTVILQKTAILKVHSPGAVKRRVLDLAFAHYGEAYNTLLASCKTLAESWLEAARADERHRLPSPKRVMKQIRPLCPGADKLDLPGTLREGLISDVAGNLLSFCELRLKWERRKEEDKAENQPTYPAPVYGYQPEAYRL